MRIRTWQPPPGAEHSASLAAPHRPSHPSRGPGGARGRGRAVLALSPGEIDVAAPIAGRGAIVGRVSVGKRDLFGDALQRVSRQGAGVQLLEVTSAGAPVFAVTSIGTGVPGELGTGGSQAWQNDRDGHRWLVPEARIGEGPLLLRLAQPAEQLEAEVARSYQNLVAIVAAALLLVALGSAFLAKAIRRLELADTALVELCRRAVAGVADVAQDNDVEVTVTAAADEPLQVAADAHKLLGALQNVIRNGIEAMGPGGFGEALGTPRTERERRLAIALRRDGGTAIVEVSDRGPGLAADVRARLFEPFVTTKRGGTGLGLAIARRVVEAHGGTIEAASRDGGGSVFRITLPLPTAQGAPGRPAATTVAE